MIQINNLTKRFDEVIAVNNLSLDIKEGITGLVGHNGAGKSTLLRLIANIYKSDSGEIFVNNEDSKSIKGKQQVFYLSDDPYVLSTATCEGMLDFYEGFFSFDRNCFFELVNIFGLPKDRRVSNFSKGMKRQLFIALALSSNCSVLLLDEAFDGLDPLVLESIKEQIIKVANENKIIVVSSHNVSLLERLCDRFIILDKGCLGKDSDVNDLGTSFNKYQVLFKHSIGEEDLIKYGLDIVSFKKIGSLYNIVIKGEIDIEKFKNEFNPILIERITMDASEVVALEMLSIRKEGGIKAYEE